MDDFKSQYDAEGHFSSKAYLTSVQRKHGELIPRLGYSWNFFIRFRKKMSIFPKAKSFIIILTLEICLEFS